MKLLGWFEGYITKPLKRRTLASTLNRALSNAEELEPLGDGDVAGGSEFIGMNRTVLVAEDHEVNQRLFQTILQNLGFQVRLASNGKEAIAAMDSTVQLVFMDVQMPEMNGYEATEGIRSAGFKVPIIAVTASAVKGEREAALEIGMSDFLTKPFKKRDLELILNTWLARTELDDATPAQDSKESEASGGGAAATVEEIPAAEIFDFDPAVDTFLGDAETVLSLVATLIGRAERSLGGIRDGLDPVDFETLRAEAHAIKGSALNLSAKRLGDAAAELEAAASERDQGSCGPLANAISIELKRLIDYSAKYTVS